jgi:hypothetical protein
MTVKPITILGEGGEELELPSKWEICDVCRGEGEHSRAVDGDGLTQSDFDEAGPEFMEDYFAGRYDKRCEECKGSGRVAVVDEDRLTEEERKAWEADAKWRREDAAIRESERRMGC